MNTLLSALKNNCFVVLFLSSHLLASEYDPSKYLNSPEPPADRPVIFAEGIVSKKGTVEEKIAFTPDGKEIFFGRHLDAKENYFKPKVMHAKFSEGKWSEPVVASFSKGKNMGWPLMSYNGPTLFMEEFEGKLLFSKKKNGKWSKPKYITPKVKAEQGFGLAQLTNDNVFYFHDRWGRVAYSSKVINGKYLPAQKLSYLINPSVEFFVSPKNDYIIFQPLNWSNQFHIIFKDEKGHWGMPVPFSVYFTDSKKWDARGYGPSISPDGKYLFFGKRGDIYWVKADFIEVLRKYKRPY